MTNINEMLNEYLRTGVTPSQLQKACSIVSALERCAKIDYLENEDRIVIETVVSCLKGEWTSSDNTTEYKYSNIKLEKDFVESIYGDINQLLITSALTDNIIMISHLLLNTDYKFHHKILDRALTIACERGNLYIIKLLVEEGKVCVRNIYPDNIKDIKSYEIIRYLNEQYKKEIK